MEFRSQTNGTQPAQARPAASTSTGSADTGSNGSGPSRPSKILVAVVVAVVALIAILAGASFWQAAQSKGGLSAKIETDKYQAVFLTNGQVYFGKLAGLNSAYAELTDVYYLQVQQAVQPAEQKNDEDKPQVSLTKLGNELHGPTDKMQISSQQVLFWENLRDDSTVVKAIKDYKNKQ